jgi:transporter family protein
MYWLVYALLSAVFAAGVAIFGKIGLKNVDSNVATAVRGVVMAVFLIGVILIQGKMNESFTLIKNYKIMYYIVLSGVAGALSWLFYFLALKAGKASQVAPIDRLSVVFVLILSSLILGETFGWKVIIGVILMVIGAILVALG